jgi:hypothetical protein
MDHFAPPSRTANDSGIPNLRIRLTLTLLHEAYDLAQAVQRDAWQFALEIGRLWAAGVTNTDLRWLLCQGYVQQGLERTPDGAPQRSFRPLAVWSCPKGVASCSRRPG